MRYHGYVGTIHLHVGASLRSVIPESALRECMVHELAPEYCSDPGWCKVNLSSIIKEDTLYFDVDGIAVRDITPLIEACKADGRPYITTVMGSGKDGDPIDYYEWAKTSKVRERMDLGHDAIYHGIQSSWCWMRKDEAMGAIHDAVLYAWDRIKESDLTYKWGACRPDELYYSAACSSLDYDPKWPDSVVFFGRGFKTMTQIKQDHYILSMWGSGRGRGTMPPRYVDQYDHLMRSIARNRGVQTYAAAHIRRDKWVNFKAA